MSGQERSTQGHTVARTLRGQCTIVCPIHMASASKCLESLELLLRLGAVVNQRDVDGWTALHFAALAGWVEGTKMLLEHKADANVCTWCDCTPILFAVKNSHADVVRVLLEYGAQLNCGNGPRDRKDSHQQGRAHYFGVSKALVKNQQGPQPSGHGHLFDRGHQQGHDSPHVDPLPSIPSSLIIAMRSFAWFKNITWAVFPGRRKQAAQRPWKCFFREMCPLKPRTSLERQLCNVSLYQKKKKKKKKKKKRALPNPSTHPGTLIF
eukprot:1160741-Pelagomonas_calceolata.AAC.15